MSTNLVSILAMCNSKMCTDANHICDVTSQSQSINNPDDNIQLIVENIKTLLYCRDSSAVSGVRCILNKQMKIMLDYFSTCLLSNMEDLFLSMFKPL